MDNSASPTREPLSREVPLQRQSSVCAGPAVKTAVIFGIAGDTRATSD